MAIDAPTMLLLTLAIAAIAAAFLAFEWRETRNPALACWSAGFAAIVAGCSITPLRQALSPFWGVWVANGLLIVAHIFFLRGTARYAGRRVAPWWWLFLLPWGLMLFVPADAAHSGIFGFATSSLVGLLALRTAWVALWEADRDDASARHLGLIFLLHGLFYALKTALIHAPGAFVDMLALKGLLIQVSLFEGILVEVLLALLMAAAVRRRREGRAAALAERDPLTGLLNRRAFTQQATALLGSGSPPRWSGALLLIDLDHFKDVNDTLGHAAGDRVLIALAEVLNARMPAGALTARLGGDEFVVLVPDTDAVELPVLGQSLRSDFAAAVATFLPGTVAATLSVGAAIPSDADDLAALMSRADAALYDSKRGGRDRLSVRAAAPSNGGGKMPTVPQDLSAASKLGLAQLER